MTLTAKQIALREFYQEKSKEWDGLANNLQNVFTPYDLCEEIIQKVYRYWEPKGKKPLVLNLEFAIVLIETGVDPQDINFLTDCEQKAKFAKNMGVNVMVEEFDDFFEKVQENKEIRTWDGVIGNPPFQDSVEKNGQRGSRTHIWDKFVKCAFEITEPNGIVALIHPSSWRRGNGKYSKIGDLIRSKQILYLELHNVDDGNKTFGATVGYDWYVSKNSENNQDTDVVDCESKKHKIDLRQFIAIPDSHLNEILPLMAKNDEKKVDFIFSCSAYEHRKPYVKQEKDETHKYPVVYSLPKSGEQIWWSSTKDKGHFGIPKVIWSNGAGAQIIVDKEGEYGMTEWAYAIADKPENLSNIKKAMESEKFLKICKYIQFSLDKYDSKFIQMFRKDFWKEFL